MSTDVMDMMILGRAAYAKPDAVRCVTMDLKAARIVRARPNNVIKLQRAWYYGFDAAASEAAVLAQA